MKSVNSGADGDDEDNSKTLLSDERECEIISISSPDIDFMFIFIRGGEADFEAQNRLFKLYV